MTLEELIRDCAERGEMVHLSLWYEPTKKRWCATYSPSHKFGVSRAYHEDPVTATVKALEGITHARSRKRHVITEPESAGSEDGEGQETTPSGAGESDAGEGVRAAC